MSLSVTISAVSPQTIKITPAGKMGSADFRDYLDRCRLGGARFDRALKAQVAPIERLWKVERELTTGGYRVKLEGALERQEERVEAPPPSPVDLYPFQVVGRDWLADRDRALLADQMGLGKTPQALCAIPAGSPVLVVAPAAVKGVWAMEAKRWRPEFVVTIRAGRDGFRWPLAGEIVIVNYDILPKLPGDALTGTVLIADEAHAVKSSKAKRTKRFAAIANEAMRTGGRVWLLTGTPLLNRPPELWQVLRAARLEEDAFGSWPRFRALFRAHEKAVCYRKTADGPKPLKVLEWGAPSEEVAECLRRVSLRRHRADVLPDLPAKTRRDIAVEGMPAETQELCDRLVSDLQSHGIDLANASQAVSLAQIQEASFNQISRVRAALAMAKIPAMTALVEEYEEEEEPLVVFSAHRGPVDLLEARPGWAVITGDVSPEERSRIVERFQAGELKGVALTIAAGGVGLTLTRAAHAVFVDLAWTPALNDQAEDRLARIGQKNAVLITRLVCEHVVDRRVTELLTTKQELIQSTVEASAV